MAKVIFYEKTGCINNTKQKELLAMAGHEVEPIDIIDHAWTKEELMSFFGGMEVKDWFNEKAPRVKSGEVVPAQFDAKGAAKALLGEHLLIRRPLLIIGGQKMVGFDKAKIDGMIGLSNAELPKFEVLMKENLDDCPQEQKGGVC